jgi:hypothetical protein
VAKELTSLNGILLEKPMVTLLGARFKSYKQPATGFCLETYDAAHLLATYLQKISVFSPYQHLHHRSDFLSLDFLFVFLCFPRLTHYSITLYLVKIENCEAF